MYIITNTTPTGEYTPSKAATLEKAKDIMHEITIDNYIAGVCDSGFYDFAEETGAEECSSYEELKEKGLVDKFLEWAKENGDLEYTEKSTAVYYDDDSFNKMCIYNTDEL